MPLKHLKPLIGLEKDETVDWKNLSEDQEERVNNYALKYAIFAINISLAFAFSNGLEKSKNNPNEYLTQEPITLNNAIEYKIK